MSVPVMIHLPADTFRALEAVAQRKGVPMRDLIVAGLMRSTQPRPVRASGQIPAPRRASGTRGWKQLSDSEWAEVKRLRAAGWTVPELAVRFGCSSSTIYKHLSREHT